MNLRQIDLNLLIVFDAIMSERNTTRAAEKLAMTQPAVSSALGRLRHITKDTLFTRTGNGMQPTTKALQIAPAIKQALNLLQNTLQSSTTFDYNTETRNFVIACSDYTEIVILPRLIDWISWVAPNVTLQIKPLPYQLNLETLSVFNELKAGRIDLVIYHENNGQINMKQQLLLTDSWTCLIKHSLNNFESSTENKISINDYFNLSHVDICTQWIDSIITNYQDHLTKHSNNKKRHTLIQTAHFATIPSIVMNSTCIATVPCRIAQHYSEIQQIRSKVPTFELSQIQIRQYWHENMDNDSGHKWLRKMIFDLCQRL